MAVQPVGIHRIGVHLPRYRLTRAAVAEFAGRAPRPGSRAVANWDEDAVTMSVEAGRRCLSDSAVDVDRIGTVIVASTTFPYAEKQSAALVAEAIDLPETVDTIDIGSSLRAGTQALRLAADRVAATGRSVLVIAADHRLTPAQHPVEGVWGDAAVAMLVTQGGRMRIRWPSLCYQTWLSYWRLAGERYGHHADARFVSQLSTQALRQAVEEAAKAAAEAGSTVTAVAVATPNERDAYRAVRDAGLPERVAVVGPDLQAEVGYTGAAAPLLALAAAAESVGDGGTIVWASLGDGADAAVVDVTGPVELPTPLRAAVAHARNLSYPAYLRLRGAVAGVDVAPFSSEIEQWRSAAHTVRLRAGRCRGCGHVAYPPTPVCAVCHRYRDMDSYRLPTRGRLYTFTVEHLFPNPEGQLAMGVVELSDGARFYAPLTDVAPDELRIGLPVRLVYRRLHLGGGFVNYFWKATPDHDTGAEDAGT